MITITRYEYGYRFHRVDDDGYKWDLGNASEIIQDAGTPDEARYYQGYFDTRPITFETPEEARAIIERRKPGDVVTIEEA